VRDYWFAECTLCTFQEKHATQDAAIDAATGHAYHVHPDAQRKLMPGGFVTHVQNRTEGAIATVPEPGAVQPPQLPQPLPPSNDTTPAPAPVSGQTPAPATGVGQQSTAPEATTPPAQE
jgi:hypothetical protein